MNILITGGAGFIGSHLTDYFLKKQHSVIVIDSLRWGKPSFFAHHRANPAFRFLQADLCDYDTLQAIMPDDVDTVFHCAANSDISRSAAEPVIDFENTTCATFNLLRALRAHDIRKLFFFSGSGVYGDVGMKQTSETHGPLLPISMYGATKLSAEAMISSFVHLYDMQAWIVRPANIIGPRATHGVVFDFINQLKQHPGFLQIKGNGKQSKSYLYIDDVINAVELVWKTVRDNISIVNISSGSHLSVNEIAAIIIREMSLKRVRISHSGGTRGWQGDVPIVRLSNRKLLSIGWRCRYTSRQAVVTTVRALLRDI